MKKCRFCPFTTNGINDLRHHCEEIHPAQYTQIQRYCKPTYQLPFVEPNEWSELAPYRTAYYWDKVTGWTEKK